MTGMSASVHATALICHVVFIDARGAEHIVALEQAGTVAFEDGRMVRKIPSYPGAEARAGPVLVGEHG